MERRVVAAAVRPAQLAGGLATLSLSESSKPLQALPAGRSAPQQAAPAVSPNGAPGQPSSSTGMPPPTSRPPRPHTAQPESVTSAQSLQSPQTSPQFQQPHPQRQHAKSAVVSTTAQSAPPRPSCPNPAPARVVSPFFAAPAPPRPRGACRGCRLQIVGCVYADTRDRQYLLCDACYSKHGVLTQLLYELVFAPPATVVSGAAANANPPGGGTTSRSFSRVVAPIRAPATARPAGTGAAFPKNVYAEGTWKTVTVPKNKPAPSSSGSSPGAAKSTTVATSKDAPAPTAAFEPTLLPSGASARAAPVVVAVLAPTPKGAECPTAHMPSTDRNSGAARDAMGAVSASPDHPRAEITAATLAGAADAAARGAIVARPRLRGRGGRRGRGRGARAGAATSVARGDSAIATLPAAQSTLVVDTASTVAAMEVDSDPALQRAQSDLSDEVPPRPVKVPKNDELGDVSSKSKSLHRAESIIVNGNVSLKVTQLSRVVAGDRQHYAHIHWPKQQEDLTFSGAGAEKELQILAPKVKGWYTWKTPDRSEAQQHEVERDIECFRGALARQIDMWKGNLDEVRTRSMALRPYAPHLLAPCADRCLGLLHRYVRCESRAEGEARGMAARHGARAN